MNSSSAARKRAYDSSRRAAEALKTRAEIVSAAAQILRDVRPENLALAEVAQRAGVSVRTVYRHFPGPKELVQAVAQDFSARVIEPLGQLTGSLTQLPDQLGALQRLLSEQPSLYPLFFAIPARTAVAMSQRVQGWAGDVLAHTPREHHAAISGMVELLGSPYAWEVLHSHWRLPPERITRTCIAALQAVLDAFEQHPEWLDPERPLPPRFRSARPQRKKARR